MHRVHQFILVLVSVVPMAQSAHAQMVEQRYGLPIHELTPVEQRVSDTGPLSTSLRQLQPGLGVPYGFDQVYRVPGRDDLLMRFDGGVTAVFPESVYTSNGDGGVSTLVPPNTVFYIGLPQADSLLRFTDSFGPATGASSMPGAASEVQPARVFDMRDELPPGSHAGDATIKPRGSQPANMPFSTRRVDPGEMDQHQRVDEEDGPAIVADDDYRAQRVRTLLQRAAQARLAHQRSSSMR